MGGGGGGAGRDFILYTIPSLASRAVPRTNKGTHEAKQSWLGPPAEKGLQSHGLGSGFVLCLTCP